MSLHARASLALLALPVLALAGCHADAKAAAPAAAPAASGEHLTVVLTSSNWGEVDPCG